MSNTSLMIWMADSEVIPQSLQLRGVCKDINLADDLGIVYIDVSHIFFSIKQQFQQL